jgi:glycosyltransferase involved in cell wall biosynthesis
MSKKIVNSGNPEFGYELLSAIPYAYNLYLKGELDETISSYDTKCLYFFSPKHTETDNKRSWDNMNSLWAQKFPNINIHKPQLDWDVFSPPPFKEFYSNKSIEFDKETIVIFNRYNYEWGQPPINYLDIPTLDKLFTLLSKDYQVVYINIKGHDKYYDGVDPLDLGDDVLLLNHPNVISINQLINTYPDLTYNEIQLRVFSKCEKYISSNGGQLILSAYFGGENIIFSKKCRELGSEVNSFYKWYHKLGNGVFQHVNTYSDLIQLVTEKWVEKKPLFNILIRTSGRPNYFNDCVNSIYSQSYKNWNIIIGVDDKKTLPYTQPAKGRDIIYDYSNLVIPNPPDNINYGIKFKFNLYLNDLQDNVNDGFVIYLDDDDMLFDNNSLQKIANNINSDDDLIFWRVKFPNRLVPSDKNFWGEPKIKDISGIGFSFHIKHKEIWEPYKRGDYRVAKSLYDKIENKVFLNETITGLQRDVEDGFGKKDDKILLLSIIIPTFNNVKYIDECLESVIKSVKDLSCEILVGIDKCENTLNHIKLNKYDKRIRFFYFENNVGPYIIKNTLTNISKSSDILFFDSDDVMKENMIPDILSNLKFYSCVKPMYINFNNNENHTLLKDRLSKTFGEGVFAIKKNVFLNLNGFEGWRCAADSEFNSRLFKNKNSLTYTKSLSFYRRIHNNSLTSKPETGYSSELRRNYVKTMNKRKNFGPLPTLVTSFFNEIFTDNIKTPVNESFIIKEAVLDIVNKFYSNGKKYTNEKNINYESINTLQNKGGSYQPKDNVKPIRQNIPNDRNKLTEIKKGSLAEQALNLCQTHPNRRNNLPNIFSNKKR